uniref:Protein involved in establishing cohesion between sister chromatids during dna replication n=1 Tax=Culex tarsalis TaxID=7177 RepID=A0A1Q3EYE8_CULTA
MSGRKKSLFGSVVGESAKDEDTDLGPMSPLKFSNSPRERRGPMKAINTTTFRNILGNASPESDRSLSPDYERRFCHSDRYEILPATHDKENSHLTDEDTRHSFPSGTPRMRTPAESALLDETNSNSLSLLMSSDLNLVDKKNLVLKTPGLTSSGQNREPKLSFRKLSFPGANAASTPTDENAPPNVSSGSERKARTSLSFGDIRPISTKSFYSSAIDVGTKPVPKPVAPPPRSKARPARKRPSAKNRGNSIRLGSLNRGVFHKIKKPTAAKPKTPAAVKKLSTSQILETTTSALLNKSVEAKPVSKSTPSSPHDRQTQQQLARIKQIMRNSKNPIEQARPLSLSRSMSNLTDLIADERDESEHSAEPPEQEEDEDDDEDVKSEGDGGGGGGGRKFFKSSANRRIRREYKVTDKVSATVGKGGKISLNRSTGKEQKKRKFKSMFEEEIDFASEQHEVDDLISKLTNHQQQSSAIEDESPQSEPPLPPEPEPVTLTFEGLLHAEISNDEPIPVQSNVIFVDRLSPLTTSSASESNDEVPPLNGFHQSPMAQIRTMTSGLAITNGTDVSEKLFPIFHKDHHRTVAQAEASQQQIFGGLFDRKRQRRLRTWRPIGHDQYQIDAGQKEYGAQQCAECGLVYTVHEPEEELIHENYHNSLHVLKFGGWINEIVVAQVPEWDVSGRVLAVTLTDGRHQLHKVQEVLAVVDRELGYVEPCQLTAGSIVYLAVARSIILGVCVAQPLQRANRLLTIEGLQGSIDCCTMETYPARCGISRIWVSPRYRGNGIARTLLSVTRSHFVFGYHMSYDEVAFSAPTEAGKRLAESVTGRKDFLIYM